MFKIRNDDSKIRSAKVGIEITEYCIRGIITNGFGMVQKVGTVNFDDGLLSVNDFDFVDKLSIRLQELSRLLGLKKDTQCVVVIGGQQIVMQQFQWEDMSLDALLMNVEMEMSSALPFSENGYLYGIRKLASDPLSEKGSDESIEADTLKGFKRFKIFKNFKKSQGTREILAVAIDKDLGYKYIQAFNLAMLKILRMDVLENAHLKLVNDVKFWTEDFGVAAEDSYLMLDILSNSVNMALYLKGKYYVGRHLVQGTALIEDETGCWIWNPLALADEVESVLEFMSYHDRHTSIDRILLFGADFDIDEIIKPLTFYIDLPIIVAFDNINWNPFPDELETDFAEYLTVYGATIIPKKDSDDLNLIPIDKEKNVKKKLIYSITAIGIIYTSILIVISLIIWSSVSELEREIEIMSTEQDTITLQMLEQAQQDHDTISLQVEEIMKFSENYIGLTEMYESIVKDIPEGIRLTEIQNDSIVIRVKGEVEELDILMQYKLWLDSQHKFIKVDMRKVTQKPLGLYEFEFSLYVAVEVEE